MVLGFDELVELLAQFGLDSAAEGAEAEAMSRRGGGARVVLIRTDGKGSIPVGRGQYLADSRGRSRRPVYRCCNGVFLSADLRELLRLRRIMFIGNM